MKWNKADLESYVKEKEYIDTLLVPIIPFQLSDETDLVKMAFQNEVLAIFLNELEKELKGRVMLTPNYHYLKSTKKEEEIDRINTWIKDANKQPFNHTFFFTFDASWKKEEQALDGTLLWLPGTHSGDVNSKEIATIIRDQVEQVSELIRSYW